MKRVQATALLAFVAGLAALALLRLESFSEPFLEFDEGIYLAMAREVAHGHLPYLTLYDAKPPGFFFLLGAAVRAFGTSIYVLRALGLVCVAATCAGIYALCSSFVAERAAIAMLAIAAYAGMTAGTVGLAANAELILTPFVVWALVPIARAVAARAHLGARAALLSGALLGIAIELKLTASGEALFAFAFAAFGGAATSAALLALAAGIALPTALVAGVYASADSLQAFLDANVGSLVRRFGHAPHEHATLWRTLLAQARAFFPASLLIWFVPVALRDVPMRERRLALWFSAWVVVDLAQVFLENERYPHQFLDAMVPAAIVGAWVAVHLLRRAVPHRLVYAGVALLAIVALAVQAAPNDRRAFAQFRGSGLSDDDAVARYLAMRLGDASLFIIDDQPLFYPLAARPVPGRYALFFSNDALVRLAGIDGPAELNRIFGTAPAVVVHNNDAEIRENQGPKLASDIADHLRADYTSVFCAGTHCVYERKPEKLRAL